jgi:hypothetical protein
MSLSSPIVGRTTAPRYCRDFAVEVYALDDIERKVHNNDKKACCMQCIDRR